MNNVKVKESVLQKDFRLRLPKEFTQFGYIPGMDFFNVFVNSENGDIILKKSTSGKVNNYGKSK